MKYEIIPTQKDVLNRFNPEAEEEALSFIMDKVLPGVQSHLLPQKFYCDNPPLVAKLLRERKWNIEIHETYITVLPPKTLLKKLNINVSFGEYREAWCFIGVSNIVFALCGGALALSLHAPALFFISAFGVLNLLIALRSDFG